MWYRRDWNCVEGWQGHYPMAKFHNPLAVCKEWLVRNKDDRILFESDDLVIYLGFYHAYSSPGLALTPYFTVFERRDDVASS